MTNEAEARIVLANKKGLHARAAAKFVKTVHQFGCAVVVAKIAGAGVAEDTAPIESSGGSILGLMMLGAECGATLRLRVQGAQALETVNALKNLVEGRFGEE